MRHITFWATTSAINMMYWGLFKTSVFGTYYLYFSSIIKIFNFRVIVLISMNLSSLLNKFFNCFSFSTITLRASMTE
nr:MAG TPA: hypothetical protein [Bacteriophage sp.]